MVALAVDEARRRLQDADHGILVTLHPTRGADPVPAVFVLDGERLFIPIDAVKPKTGTRLRRVANIEGDSRVAFLVEEYDADWSRLWWVRAHGHGAVVDDDHVRDRAAELLLDKYPRYSREDIVAVVAMQLSGITGWAAASPR